MNYLSQYYGKMKEVGIRLTHQFIVDIPVLGEDFKFFATSASLPGRTLEETELQYHGFTFRVPTVTTFEGSFEINIISDMANEIRSNIEVWENDHANLAMGGGGKKRIPIEVAHLHLLDETLGNNYLAADANVQRQICTGIDQGRFTNNPDGCVGGDILRSYTMVGVYPKTYSELSLDTTTADKAEFSLTLSYQYWYDSTGNDTSKDPLS